MNKNAGLANFFDLVFNPGGDALVITDNTKAIDCIDQASNDFFNALDSYANTAGINVKYSGSDEVFRLEDEENYISILLYKALHENTDHHSDNTDMICFLKKHLQAGGSVYIVDDNRLALRTMSGYDFGLENVDNGILRSELINLARDSHMKCSLFYVHPYIEDIEFLFSDKRLPHDEHLQMTVKEGILRVVFFNEAKRFSDAVTEGIYPGIANQFIAVFSEEASFETELIYRKYSVRRDERFIISTSIYQKSDGKLFVTKSPVGDKSREHVLNMKKHYQDLYSLYKDSPLCINRTYLENSTDLRFDFCEGESLEEILDRLLESDDTEGFYRWIETQTDMLSLSGRLLVDPGSSKGTFKYGSSEEFTRLFGRLSDTEEEMISCEKYLKLSDLDIIFSNFMINHDIWTLLDYEWIVDFPVPFSFLLYRAIYFYFCSVEYRDPQQKRMSKCMAHFGISEDLQTLYAKMYASFDKYVTGERQTYLKTFTDVMDQGFYISREDVYSMITVGAGICIEKCEYFIDSGNGYSAENQLLCIPDITEDHLSVVIPVRKTDRSVRFDPAEKSGLMMIYGIYDENGSELDIKPQTNASRYNDNTYLFSTCDPQVIIKLQNRHPASVRIDYDFTPFSEKTAAGMKQLFEKKNDLSHLLSVIRAK